MNRFAAFLAAGLALGACRSPTRAEVFTEAFSGVLTDAPAAVAVEHRVRVAAEGTLTASLAWDDVPSAQPAGRAELRLEVRDQRGVAIADTLDAPGGSPLEVSAAVSLGTYRLVVSPRFRDRIGFYCLCDVPYRLRVDHP